MSGPHRAAARSSTVEIGAPGSPARQSRLRRDAGAPGHRPDHRARRRRGEHARACWPSIPDTGRAPDDEAVIRARRLSPPRRRSTVRASRLEQVGECRPVASTADCLITPSGVALPARCSAARHRLARSRGRGAFGHALALVRIAVPHGDLRTRRRCRGDRPHAQPAGDGARLRAPRYPAVSLHDRARGRPGMRCAEYATSARRLWPRMRLRRFATARPCAANHGSLRSARPRGRARDRRRGPNLATQSSRSSPPA